MNFQVAHLISRLRATHVAMEDKVPFDGLKLVLSYNEATNIYCELYGATQSYFIYTSVVPGLNPLRLYLILYLERAN